MKRTRVVVLALLAAGILTAAAVLLVGGLGTASPVRPKELAGNDQEIVWLNSATSGTSWERFVAAIHHVARTNPEGRLHVECANARQSAPVPEVALWMEGVDGRLWVRWYKTTREMSTAAWVQQLAERPRPPLAIIGGSSSDRARELAVELERQRARFTVPPLFFITQATADEVNLNPREPRHVKDLMDLYPGRSFRFCFTNRQMAQAVTNFVRNPPAPSLAAGLCPDSGPVYVVAWRDDPYSMDLRQRFCDNLSQNDPSSRLPWPAEIAYFEVQHGVGDVNQPNALEIEEGQKLIDKLAQHKDQTRPLLFLPATNPPARRFLRGLVRSAPAEAERLVVATGDAISFNEVYRDRNFAWPVQDLPFKLVLFCHRNPVDRAAGFLPEDEAGTDPARCWRVTGTEDLLLYTDILESAVRVAFRPGGLLSSAEELARGLRDLRARVNGGREPRFDAKGNLRSGAGEYVVYLEPKRGADGRVLPEATLHVYVRAEGTNRGWAPVGPPLRLDYRAGAGGNQP
jgi:hypothetical protein